VFVLQLLRIASVAPEGTPWARELRAFEREVDAQTHGEVRIKLSRVNGHVLHATPEYDDCKKLAEENKVRDRVNLPGRKRSGLIPQRGQTLNLPAVLLHRAVARHALAYRRERRLLSGLDSRVAILAFDLQRRMLLVAEVDRLVGACRPGYGKENATSESE